MSKETGSRRAAGGAETAAARSSTMKTILLHVQNDATFESRLEAALGLARACSAHLNCLHVTPIEAYVAFDAFGGVFVMNDVIKALDEEETSLRARIEKDLRGEDVSWDYLQVTGNVTSQIIRHAALSDLVVTGRAAHRNDFADAGIDLLGDLLHRSRTPLFIAGDSDPCDPAGRALIAWDGSYEAANAVRGAIGLLRLASDVRVLQITEQKEELFPNTWLVEYLSRHGIHAELQVEPAGGKPDGDFISRMLLAQARSYGAAYMVMGGYNHSRMGQFLFGGVTRNLLLASPVALVMAH